MKLHLPKLLLTAVLAACVAAPSASAASSWGSYNGKNCYYLDGDEGDVTKQTAWTDFGIAPEHVNQVSTIKSFTISNGDILSVFHNPWGTGTGASERDFKLLTIENLIVENGGNATFKTDATNTATINTITGAVAVENKGTLTIGTTDGTTTFSGTITNTGTMSVHGAVAVTNLSAFTVQTAGTVSWSDSTNSQGFQISEGSTYILSSGGVTYDSPDGLQVNDNGIMRDVTITDGTATFRSGSVTGTTYYVTNADVTAGAAGTEGATAYDVASGRTLTINSSAADGVALNLQSGSTVSISNASREFTSSSLAYNVEIGDGGVVTVSGCNDWGDAWIQGTVDVNAGGTLKLNASDSAGWSGGKYISAINMVGTADKLATVELKGKQTLTTAINMKGNALMSNIGDGALEFFGGKITAEGTNNVIAGNLMARGANSNTNNDGDSYIEVKANGELKITGDLTCNTGQYGTPGSIYKQGEGKLILAGNNTVYNGFNVNAGTVELVKGMTLGTATSTGSLTVDAGAALDIGDTIYSKTGAVTINGALNIANNNNYKLYEAATEVSYSHGANGYYTSSGSKFYAIQGTGTIDIANATITYNGNSTTLTEVDDGYVFTAGEFTDKSTFYVNEGKVTANTGVYTDIYEADTYRIAAGTELDVNGQYFAGASFILAEGAKLSNTGNGLNGNYKMFQSIELSGDATVHAHSNMGLLAFNSSDAAAATSTLKLNGHTLTKTGGAAFFLTGTTVEGNGTIKIKEGTLQVGIEVTLANTADTNATGVDFVLDGGTLSVLESGNKLTAKSLSGTGAVTGNGVVELNNTGTAQDHTITGNVKVGALYLLGNDNYTINGNLTVSGAENGYAKIKAKGLTLGEGTHSIGRLDLSDNNTSTATLTLNSGANLTVSGTMWLGLEEKTPGIKLGKGASLTRGEVKFIGSTDSESSISRVTDGNHADEYGIGNASYVVKNAAVEVTSAENKTMYNRLQGVALSNIGTGKLTVGNSHNNLTELKALTGDIDLAWYNGQGNQGTISNLNIAAERTVGAYVRDVGSGKATVTVSGLTAGAGATLNANLILTDGASLAFDGALALGNSTLTLGSGLTLNADTLAAIKNLSGDDTVALFTGVGTLTLGDDDIFTRGTDVLDATSGIDLSKYFSLADAQTPAVLSDEQLSSGYYLGFDANGTLYAGVIPEPTTATLSLLALAALAARRRRK